MKNTLIIILVCGFIGFGLTGCENNKKGVSIGQESNIEIIEANVSFYIKEKDLSVKSSTDLLCFGMALFINRF